MNKPHHTFAPTQLARQRFVVQGRVQGVGFRPFVYVLAENLHLSGTVGNTEEGVVIEVQGPLDQLAQFTNTLQTTPPPLAQITSCVFTHIAIVPNEEQFTICESHGAKKHKVLVGPDVALCKQCLQEIHDASNRRHQFAFTNCTNCGPRYSITRHIPYDRATTSMACFPLCPDCKAEYTNPRNRRFHAQPNACKVCGPTVWFYSSPNALAHPTAQKTDGEKNLQKIQKSAPNTSLSCAQGEAQRHVQEENLDCAQGEAQRYVQEENLDCAQGEAQRYVQEENLDCAQGEAKSALHESSSKKAKFVNDAALHQAVLSLQAGRILALKGLGGFHLACDAFNAQSVALLRKRKNRPAKPFALMVPNIDTARELSFLCKEEESLLQSIERPIVLVTLNNKWKKVLQGISPDTTRIGLMLPYTPLHEALFMAIETAKKTQLHTITALVMTSGNRKGMPICLGNREALKCLAPIADDFLLHNRDILIRVDDSVVQYVPTHGPLFFRRARGYVPSPLTLPLEAVSCTALGVGADLKNSLSLNKENQVFTSQYIGDMENLQTTQFHQEISEHLQNLLQISPDVVVVDKHPHYASNALGTRLSAGKNIPLMALQHHVAHAFAVLGEHKHLEPAIAVSLDGTGYGDDNTLWGGEFFLITPEKAEYSRLAHASPLPLPGGEQAIHEPWRIAHALLWQNGLLASPDAKYTKNGYPLPWMPLQAPIAKHIPTILKQNINCPQTTSIGRFFDAVSALMGICTHVDYEGQAAIRLEQAQEHLANNDAKQWPSSTLTKQSFSPNSKQPLFPACPSHQPSSEMLPVLDTNFLFLQIVAALEEKNNKKRIASSFHTSLCQGIANLAHTLARQHHLTHIAFSGGCLQNETCISLLSKNLHGKNCTPLFHKNLPPNDSCISFGQVYYALLHAKHHRKHHKE